MTDVPDLLYMRARYYSPSIGRFINKDPIGGLNQYVYCEGNPINWVDPLGLCQQDENGINALLGKKAYYIEQFGKSLTNFASSSGKYALYGMTIGIIITPFNPKVGIPIFVASYIYGQASDRLSVLGVILQGYGENLKSH